MKKQMAFRRARSPGQPVEANPYDDSDQETLEGNEEEMEEESDEEPAQDGLPRVKDIAQVYLFFNYPFICLSCVLSTFIRPTGALQFAWVFLIR